MAGEELLLSECTNVGLMDEQIGILVKGEQGPTRTI